MRTTPPPLTDIARQIPELVSLARTTVRLHPRRGEGDLGASKMGGVVLWPADEPWPTCPEHEDHLVPVVQLRKGDVPEMPFPRGKDLFQLLWCPNEHGEMEPEEMLAHRVFWREEAQITDPLDQLPTPGQTEEGYAPKPCVLHPECVIEYPPLASLPEELEQRVEAVCEGLLEQTEQWDIDEPLAVYADLLSAADGTKVGGHVNWVQDDETPECQCGQVMEHLLTIASAEFDGGTYPRWCAQEDSGVWDADYEKRHEVQCAADLLFGDMGNLYFFVCRKCKPWRIYCVFQCS